MNIVVTGEAGFIVSRLVRQLIGHTNHEKLAVDTSTYAGCRSNSGDGNDGNVEALNK